MENEEMIDVTQNDEENKIACQLIDKKLDEMLSDIGNFIKYTLNSKCKEDKYTGTFIKMLIMNLLNCLDIDSDETSDFLFNILISYRKIKKELGEN